METTAPRIREKGSAMVVALLMTFVLMGLILGYCEVVLVDADTTDSVADGIQAEAVAQAGIAIAINELRAGADIDNNGTVGTVGSPPGVGTGPRRIGNGYYFTSLTQIASTQPFMVDSRVTCVASSATEFTPSSRGYKGGAIRKMTAFTTGPAGGPLWFAIFAGNKDGSLDAAPINADPNDPKYQYNLLLSGIGTQGDNVVGGIYSGKNLFIKQDSKIRSAAPGDPNYSATQGQNTVAEAKSANSFTVATGGLPNGVSVMVGSEKIPDLTRVPYKYNNQTYEGSYQTNAQKAFNRTTAEELELAKQYVDVKRELTASGTSGQWNSSSSTYTNAANYNGGHGNALQIRDRANPAHIFRRNPSDRNLATMNNATFGDDYYLEDPTTLNTTSGVNAERVAGTDVDTGFTGINASTGEPSGTPNAYAINLTRNTSDPTRDGNQKVYYVDGNVWISDLNGYSMFIKNRNPADPTKNDPNGTQITIVARGNVYFGDNIFYQDMKKDGVVFIAMKDERTPTQGGNPDPQGSGNIFIGDPEFGTLRRLESYLYADNDFVDNNVTTSGSAQFTILGNMTAGDEVRIRRDKLDSSGNVIPNTHSRMDVFFDSRIRNNKTFAKMIPGVTALLPDDTGMFTIQSVVNSAYNPAVDK